MLTAFIYGLEIALIALLGALVYRIHQLYSEAGYAEQGNIDKILKRLLHGNTASDNLEYTKKMESLKKAQTFSGVQLMEIKRNYGNLSQNNLEWLREAVSLYLIGAIDLIGKEAKCSTQVRKELIMLVLKSNLSLTTEVTEKYYREALYRKLSSDNDLMVRAGAKAAKSWSTNHQTPKEMSLVSQLDDWGVFA